MKGIFNTTEYGESEVTIDITSLYTTTNSALLYNMAIAIMKTMDLTSVCEACLYSIKSDRIFKNIL